MTMWRMPMTMWRMPMTNFDAGDDASDECDRDKVAQSVSLCCSEEAPHLHTAIKSGPLSWSKTNQGP